MKIAVCMIVRDEAHIIARCLDSLKPIADGIVILDTGSVDGTIATIEEWATANSLPCEVPLADWTNFAEMRNLALEYGRRSLEGYDFAIMIDADEVLVYKTDFDADAWKGALDPQVPFYSIETRRTHVAWNRPQLINLRANVEWRGAVHEFLDAHGVSGGMVIDFWNNAIQDSARNQNPQAKFLRDAEALDEALKKETDPGLRARYTFYAAQSYRDAGEIAKAIPLYMRRWEIKDGWSEERYVAAWQAGKLYGQLGASKDKVLLWLDRATDINSARIEALHEAAVYCRGRHDWSPGWLRIRRALEVVRYGIPLGVLFPERWRYVYGIYDEAVVCSYWMGLPDSSAAFCQHISELGEQVPPDVHSRTASNLNHAVKLRISSGNP